MPKLDSNNLFLGSTAIKRAYSGSTLIFNSALLEEVEPVEFVDGAAIDNQTSNANRTLTLTTHEEGDLLFAMIANRETTTTPDVLEGWFDLGWRRQGSSAFLSTQRTYRLFWKIAESNSETISWNGAYGFLLAFRNAVTVVAPRAELAYRSSGSPLPFPVIYDRDTSGKGFILAGGVGSSGFTSTNSPYSLLQPTSTSNRFAGFIEQNTSEAITSGGLAGSNFVHNTWSVEILPFEPTAFVAPEGAILLDTERTSDGYRSWRGGQTVVNAAGDEDFTRFVPAVSSLDFGKRYWEIECAGGNTSYNGYMGVVTEEQRDNWNTDANPIAGGSIGYRGIGSIWSNNSQEVTGLPTFGAGDIVMLCFDAATRSLWVGKNGVWSNDPDTDPPTYSSGAGTVFYPSVQGRDPNEGGTLRSLPSQWSYAKPESALGLADFEVTEEGEFADSTGGIEGGYIEGGKFYKFSTFLSGGDFEVTEEGKFDYLIVAGGGGGGSGGSGVHGGGGGAGGLLTGSTTLSTGTYPIVIGEGGLGATGSNSAGNSGQDSTAFGLTAKGGGRGGTLDVNGGNGGSGGGAGSRASGSAVGGTAEAGQGNDGGARIENVDGHSSASGGGATGVGQGTQANVQTVGGAGLVSSIDGTTKEYAKGGDGKLGSGAGISADAFTGNGGQGGGTGSASGGNGGSGIVIIRCEVSEQTFNAFVATNFDATTTSIKAGSVMNDEIPYTDTYQSTSIKAGSIVRDEVSYTDAYQSTSIKAGVIMREV